MVKDFYSDIKKNVELVAWLQNPDIGWGAEDSAFCGALGCHNELSSSNIHAEEHLKKGYDKEKERIFKETSGRGHGAVLDQSSFAFSIDNLTRASTLFLCTPQYASHLQQTLRKVSAERGFYLPESLVSTPAKKLMEAQFELYEEMKLGGIPPEDARYILPLYTKTTIQTLVNARELMHLDSMVKREGVPYEVKETIEEMVNLAKEKAPNLMKDRENNYETLAWLPSSQLYSHSNNTINTILDDKKFNCDPIYSLGYSGIPMSQDAIKNAVINRDETELANLKHYHFTFLASMSLASFHQSTRQRTWDQSIQPIRESIKSGAWITPPSIEGTAFENKYHELVKSTLNFVNKNIDYPDYLGIVPHSLHSYDLIHVNGWNAIHSIGKRTCTKAQWEIRTIAKGMVKSIKKYSPELGDYCGPQGKVYGKCPERNSCGICR
jgi:thymidylate synthase ThyX